MRNTHLLVAACLAAAACAGTTGPQTPDDIDRPPAADYRGVPGFDTRDYPGDGVMARWRETSPYRWVGYYLQAPCYTGTTWIGKRVPLEQMGWAMAPLYVGEQDWRAMGAATDSTPTTDNPSCTSGNLTEPNGQAHALDAAQKAFGAGFPPGSVIYLDVERVEDVSPELADYVGAWVGRMLDQASYLPGLYVHARNAEALLAIAAAEYEERARFGQPHLWIASSEGFDVRAAPSESGFANAAIWQGAFNRDETWGDVTVRIDVNVAQPGLPGIYVPGRLDLAD